MYAMLFFKGNLGIAVIEMQGIIGTTIKEPEYSRLLESVQNNRKIGALVLDIDSPGESATAGDLIYENGSSVAQRKPVVASVRGLPSPSDRRKQQPNAPKTCPTRKGQPGQGGTQETAQPQKPVRLQRPIQG